MMNHLKSNKDQLDSSFQGDYIELGPTYQRRALLNDSFRSVINQRDQKESFHSKVALLMERQHQREEFLSKLSHNQHEKKPTTGRETFPLKVHKMLEDAENENNQDIIGWEPDGLSFKIHNPEEFEKVILQRYFHHNSFKSFQRQLYHYHFRKISYGPPRGAYFHPQFMKHDKSQCPRFKKKLRSDSGPDVGNQFTDRAKQIRDQILPAQNRVTQPSKSSFENNEIENPFSGDDIAFPMSPSSSKFRTSNNEISAFNCTREELTYGDQSLQMTDNAKIENPFSRDDIALPMRTSSGTFRTTNDDISAFNFMSEEVTFGDQSVEMVDMEPLPLGRSGDLNSPEMRDLLSDLFGKPTDVASVEPSDSTFGLLSQFSAACQLDIEPISLAQTQSNNKSNEKSPQQI